jgi:hypothetical protein
MLLDGKLIQFADLIICERQYGLKIPPQVKASLLFPELKLQRKKRRKLMSYAPTPDPPSKSKQANNRLATVETNAFALMDESHPANADLITRASHELKQAYENVRQGINNPQNSDFVPSEAERLRVLRRLEE